MLYNTTIIDENSRNPDSYYEVMSGSAHVHAIKTPIGGNITLKIIHYYINSQDFSLRVWFSDRILDSEKFKLDSDGVVSLGRIGETFVVFDSNTFPNESKKNPSGVEFYFNILNMQNAINRYKLEII